MGPGNAAMDIVDAQIHIGPGGIDAVEASMDARGISAVLVDEEWMWGLQQQPHYPLAGGGFRPIGPTAQLAAMLKPERFSWLLRIKRLDPEYAALARLAGLRPSGRGQPDHEQVGVPGLGAQPAMDHARKHDGVPRPQRDAAIL